MMDIDFRGYVGSIPIKVMLNAKGIAFEEIILGNDATSVSVKAIFGNITVPQIFFDGKIIGSSDYLEDYLKSY
ncbi:MAG: hypothetical protein KUG73_12975 [Pseudomonadales bacterium]|nr:hypothetical protein [Pseudomonadales bacterium]